MKTGQLYLLNLTWRAPNEIGSIIPGKLPIPVTFNADENIYEASIPAYAHEEGRDMQLGIKSTTPCVIIGPSGETPLFEIAHQDTGEHWWIEKGTWESRGRYHDAPSFHRPGGSVVIQTAEWLCRITLYDPCMSPAEFTLLLDDIKNWCWRMITDEACYVTVTQDSEVRLLSPDFIQFANKFIRNIGLILKVPHCELRESVESQPYERLRPNNHSLRFIAQRGERNRVPGRSAIQHFNTAENRFVLAMLNRIISMLRWTNNAACDSVRRFERTADQYEKRAKDLDSRTTEQINPSVLEEMLRRSKQKNDEIQSFLKQGHQLLKVTSEPGKNPIYNIGEYKNTFAVIRLGDDANSIQIQSKLSECGSIMVIGRISGISISSGTGSEYYRCSVHSIIHLGVWRDYAKECEDLEKKRDLLQKKNWEQDLPKEEMLKRKQEAKILTTRAKALRVTAAKTNNDAEGLNSLLGGATSAVQKFKKLGITPDFRFIPTMVFLQSPSYSGAVSIYRQLLSLAGVNESELEGLLALEDVGLRDWPGIYERWCLVSLLRVLQDDFRFHFDTHHVRDCLLKYCTGQKSENFAVTARRADMDLQLTLQYQVTLPNGRKPDFLLEIGSVDGHATTRCVLDAKACNFRKKQVSSPSAPFEYIDDCIQELVHKKNYGENDRNRVFVLHASQDCIAQPTTIQPWANSSTYGGDKVFSWESQSPQHRYGGVLIRPEETAHLKRLILMLIQQDLNRHDICASCGAGGKDVWAKPGSGKGEYHRCTKCGFLSVSSHCYNCKKPIMKNQAWWTYHDLHPTDVWNIKCCACGSLLTSSIRERQEPAQKQDFAKVNTSTYYKIVDNNPW